MEITLKNVAVEPVIWLTATLELNRSFDFAFGVTPSHPLQPDRSTSSTLSLIGGGFSDNVSYHLTIDATLQSGARFVYTKTVHIVGPAVKSYTKPVQIVEPPQNNGIVPAVVIAGVVAAGLVTFVLLRRRTAKF